MKASIVATGLYFGEGPHRTRDRRPAVRPRLASRRAIAGGVHGTPAAAARVDPDGSVHEAAGDLHFPNGCVITPVGGLSNRRVWAPLGMRAPDSICLDAEGCAWVANAIAPECVRFAPGGAILATVETDQPCFACMPGGPERRSLYVLTAPSSVANIAAASRQGRVLRADVATPGRGGPESSRQRRQSASARAPRAAASPALQ